MENPYEPPASPPPPESAGQPPGLPPFPWEDRARLGMVEALIGSVKLLVTRPGEAYERMRRTGDLWSPISFAIIFAIIGGVLGSLPQLFMGGPMLPAEMPEEQRQMMNAFMRFGILLAPIFAVIAVFVWSGLIHLCLMIVGGLKQSQAGFEGTLRCVSYAQVVAPLQIIPFLGGLAAMVWALVLEAIGIMKQHRATELQAILGVLLPFVLCCVCIGIVIFMVFSAGMAAGLAGAGASR